MLLNSVIHGWVFDTGIKLPCMPCRSFFQIGFIAKLSLCARIWFVANTDGRHTTASSYGLCQTYTCSIFDCMQSFQSVIHNTSLFTGSTTITPSQVSQFSRMGFELGRKFELAQAQQNKVVTDNRTSSASKSNVLWNLQGIIWLICDALGLVVIIIVMTLQS